ncbi:pantetheine-phosphate adenylyltransferase [Caldinitratiruptor microaerophilus]|uniref:Phosphopantetheine adenylyltransferase n=1 Tax=Caldinitratiruptor microaerophilus TaxID=671077 RepID=A0AA35G817_9FIRM|nr:pantetheine-phosphate adenylyltransferase [Caldinitratiruptor microaerophilus]BDG60621.1 phosphopantetheine adenylyltransferase [Caldinitratiruptor microaerophilus]
MTVKAICPGSYDPPTCGHLDIIERASRIFSEVLVGVPVNSTKVPLFSLEERLDMLRTITAHLDNVSVIPIHGLTIEAARAHGCRVIVRGMRAVQDFDYEFQMGMMNRKLAPDVETMFLMSDFKYMFISSTLVKDVARHGGDLDGLVPPVVAERLRDRYAVR